jgi:hypothetical protein
LLAGLRILLVTLLALGRRRPPKALEQLAEDLVIVMTLSQGGSKRDLEFLAIREIYDHERAERVHGLGGRHAQTMHAEEPAKLDDVAYQIPVLRPGG